MPLFRKTESERAVQAAATQARANRALRRGNAERGIQLAVQAKHQEEGTPWWRRL